MNAMYTQWVEIISKVVFLFLQLQKSKKYFYSCQLTRKMTSLFVRNSKNFGFVYIPPWGCFARKKCWISNKSWCHFWIELNSWKKPVCTSVLMRNIWNPYDTALKLKTHICKIKNATLDIISIHCGTYIWCCSLYLNIT